MSCDKRDYFKLVGKALARSTLRGRLIQLILLSILPPFVLILYSAAEQRRQDTTRAEREAFGLARVVAASQKYTLDSARHLLVALSNLPEVQLGKETPCNNLFAKLLNEYPIYLNLAAATAEGRIFCSALPLGSRVNISDRPYFKKSVREKTFAISDYQIGRISGKPTVSLSYPVITDDGTVKAIVLVSLDLDAFASKAASDLPVHSMLTVYDRHGNILLRYPKIMELQGTAVPNTAFIRTIFEKAHGVAEGIGIDGVERLYGFTSLIDHTSKPSIYLTIGIPKSLALADASRSLRRNLLALAFVSIIALCAAWWGGNLFFVKPIRSLIWAAENLRSGEPGVRTQLSPSISELRVLSGAFDNMAETIESRHAQVVRQTEHIRALHEIDLAITSTMDLGSMLRVVLEKVDLVLPSAVSTVRIKGKGAELEPVACRNIDEETWRQQTPRVPRGLALAVIENHAPVAIEDLESDPRAEQHQFTKKFGLISYLGLPLIVNGSVLGVLSFYTRERHSFTDEETGFLTTLAGQLAIVLHKANLYANAQRYAHEISALNEMTLAVTQSLDVEAVLTKAIEKITEIFRFDATRIFLYNEDGTELSVHAAYESQPDFWVHQRPFKPGQGIIGTIAEHDEPLVIEDVQTDHRYSELSTTGFLKKQGSRLLVGLPISTRMKKWGAMVCIAYAPRKLEPSEVTLLSSMAHQAGIALEKATLYEQATARANELAVLYSLVALASASLDLEVVLSTITDKVLEIFGFSASRLYVYSETDNALRLINQKGIPPGLLTHTGYTLGQGRIGKVMETGEPMFVDDLASLTSEGLESHAAALAGAGFRSSFIIPIIVHGERFGVMGFLSERTHSFSSGEIRLIQAVAYHLGVALGNANLFSKIHQKSMDLEKANKAKMEFLGVVSHELRTPINIIKGYTDLQLGGVFGDVNSEQQAALEKVSRQTKELLDMVNRTLQATAIEANTAKVDIEDVALTTLLDELKSNYLAYQNRRVSITWHYDETLPTLRTDSEKVRIILSNLINNAFKFTEAGSVTVTAGLTLEANMVSIQVADTGIGLPPDKLQSIFNMFEQVDGSSTRRHSGVGLGLYIVKKFVELLGGEIRVHSEIGKGTSFTVLLPRVSELTERDGGPNTSETSSSHLTNGSTVTEQEDADTKDTDSGRSRRRTPALDVVRQTFRV